MTEEQKELLVNIFNECSLTEIRDVLVDNKIVDEETFPQFYRDIANGFIMSVKGYLKIGNTIYMEGEKYILSK